MSGYPQYTPGRLDRIITIQRRAVTRDPAFGGEIESFVDVAEVWASVNQTSSSKKFANESNRTVALRNSTFRIRWRDDVRETWRVIYNNFLWDIKGRAEVGFRRFLDLHCVTDTSRRLVEEPARSRRDAEVEDEVVDRKPFTEASPGKPEEAGKPEDWTDGPQTL